MTTNAEKYAYSIRHRATLKGTLTRLNKYLQEAQDLDFVDSLDIETKLLKLDETFKKFDNVQLDVELSYTYQQVEDDSIHKQERESFERTYYSIKNGFNALLRHSQQQDEEKAPLLTPKSSTSDIETSSPPPTPKPYSPNIKLPKLELPTFEGSYTSWLGFRDLFTSIIHDNTTISGAQKLQYLKVSLKGEASKLLQNITVSNDNYITAWELVCKRYENKRQIVKSHLKVLFAQQNLATESANALRRLLDTTIEVLRALKTLNQPIEEWDTLVVHVVVEKLDGESRRLWELELSDTFPSFEDLTSFITKRYKSLEAVGSSSKSKKTSSNNHSMSHHTYSHQQQPQQQTLSYKPYKNCAICQSTEHFANFCPQFQKATVEDRISLCKKLHLCTNCMYKNHDWKSCPSNTSCKHCKKRHHTMLCYSTGKALKPQQQQQPPPVGQACVAAVAGDSRKPSTTTTTLTSVQNNTSDLHENVSVCLTRDKMSQQVLLSTAIIKFKDSSGRFQTCRALLDSGSQSSFITESCAQNLSLKRLRSDILISGIGESSSIKSKGVVKLQLYSNAEEFVLNVSPIIISKITGDIPNASFCPASSWTHLSGIHLADPEYYLTENVEILLGADVFFDLLLPNRIVGPPGSPTAINTLLGWVISGKIESSNTHIISNLCTLDFDLKSFWRIEEINSKNSLLTEEEKFCENHYLLNHSRDETGRYTVKLPFKPNSTELGNSKASALSRFKSIERRFQKNPQIKKIYCDFMQEYIDMNHMIETPANEINKPNNCVYYLPHHIVEKPDSTTTRYRVVFDGSAKTTTNISLNEKMAIGPTLQDELIEILMRFRLHKIAFTADISKMYRQIKIHSDHQDFQRIVWRSCETQALKEYTLSTVTYGTSSAPYLAIRTLHQLANDEKSTYPLGAAVATKDFYVDDLMSGAENEKSALEIQQQIIKLCNSGGFPLRKGSSNSTALLNSLPAEDRETKTTLKIDEDFSIKTLGLIWTPSSDIFTFKVRLKENSSTTTKRMILSEIAKLFDPLGWLSPVIITAKILMQNLWLLELSWDQEVPDHVRNQWLEYKASIPEIENLKINRYVSKGGGGEGKKSSYSLYGFSDASEKAYAAVIYLSSSSQNESGGEKFIQLIISKTRVSPLKQISIPRLELCAALLLAKLLKKVETGLNFTFENIYAFTDSTIVLSWLSKPPKTWTTFVANRVSEIQDILSPGNWHHVISGENPADIASRGISPNQLIKSQLWWSGPDFLQNSSFQQQQYDDPKSKSEERKIKIVTCTTTTMGSDLDLLSKYSSFSKLQRVTAYVFRFINNCKKSSTKLHGFLSPLELKNAILFWIKKVQNEAFFKEIHSLKSKMPLSKKSNILQLTPFLDSDGLLRVGGRLKNAKMSSDKKFPLLLPKDSILTKMIIIYEHEKHLHAGNQLLLSILQQKYWVINARKIVKNVINHCIVCFRQKGQISQQFMGDLPNFRIEPARAFIRTGVDYGGPFLIKASTTRNSKTLKSYICLFVCMVTKAIHIELASSLSTDDFLSCLKRFISRRGLCSDIYSDNGKNFVGAENELKELQKLVQSQEYNSTISSFLSIKGINWHFIPPYGPHFGGLWEAGIKSTKKHLIKIIGGQILTFEEFYTVLTQIESVLNSRPLCPLSTDPSDLQPLTPGHFLIGDSLTAFPEPDLTHLKLNRLSRYQLTQQLLQHFWKRWSSEYISQLQQRNKWKYPTENIKIDDLVIIKEDTAPINWKMGRVIETHPGTDNQVRVVTLKTAEGELKRPIAKVCLLPIKSS